MVSNVVYASFIAGFLYLIFSVRILLVSFTLSNFSKSSPTLLQVLQPLGLALCWMCDLPQTGCARRTTRTYERGYIVPGPDSFGGARDWSNIWVFVTNKLEIM